MQRYNSGLCTVLYKGGNPTVTIQTVYYYSPYGHVYWGKSIDLGFKREPLFTFHYNHCTRPVMLIGDVEEWMLWEKINDKDNGVHTY